MCSLLFGSLCCLIAPIMHLVFGELTQYHTYYFYPYQSLLCRLLGHMKLLAIRCLVKCLNLQYELILQHMYSQDTLPCEDYQMYNMLRNMSYLMHHLEPRGATQSIGPGTKLVLCHLYWKYITLWSFHWWRRILPVFIHKGLPYTIHVWFTWRHVLSHWYHSW